MVRLRELRTQRGWTLEQMHAVLGVSVATLSRIEACERAQGKYRLEERVARPLLTRINEVFGQTYGFDDLEGIVLAPPRPGRPRKGKDESGNES